MESPGFSKQNIDAQRITKPIQLLAAWLIGLCIIDGSFLGAAVSIGGGWERLILVFAAVLNVPGFLLAIFLLQTKFRPELQEDSFYYDYIGKKTNNAIEISRMDIFESKISAIQMRLEEISLSGPSVEASDQNEGYDWSHWKVAININLPFFKDILDGLKQNKIEVAVFFGNGMPLPTTQTVVSISEYMDSKHVFKILKILIEFPIEKIDFWEPMRDVGEDEDVYIGAYGPHKDAVLLNSEIRGMIRNASSYDQIKNLVGR